MDSKEFIANTSDSVISVLKWKPDEKNIEKSITCTVSNPDMTEIELVNLEYVFEPRVNISQEILANGDADNDSCKLVKLTCDWVANPMKVNFAWFVNGVKLQTDSKYLIITKRDLQQGKQTVICEATNKVGTGRHEINLFCKYLLHIQYIFSIINSI